MDQNAPDLNQVLLDLNQKLGALTAQVAYLTEQAEQAERRRQEQAELFEGMLPIAKDVMRIASDNLAEVEEYVELEDLLRLAKKLARRRPQLEMLVDQIDTVTDLLEVAGPITKEGMARLTLLLSELEAKGYFGFAEGGLRLVDNVVTSFTREDVDRLGDNVVLILNTVKEMTQPEIMNFVRATLHSAEEAAEKPVDISILALLRQMNDPAVRRGLALTMRVLRGVGLQAAGSAA